MNVGMMWYDGDRELSMAVRVEKAARYYQQKYGRSPTLCLVHPTAEDLPARVRSVEVQALDRVLPNHFWLGIKPKPGS